MGRFTNINGEAVTLRVDMAIYSQDPTPPLEDESTQLLVDEEIDTSSFLTFSNFVAYVTGSSPMKVPMSFWFENPFNFDLSLSELRMDVLMKDLDGSPDFIFLFGTL